MKYKKFGDTGAVVSVLGCGCMRLPARDGAVDEEHAVAMIRKAMELGVNYFDSGWFYHGGDSERVLGKAVKGAREKVYIATKCPGGNVNAPGDYRKTLEEQLKRLDTSYIDFYHFHGMNYTRFFEIEERSGWMKEAVQAKDEGIIKHISFSFHGPQEDIAKLTDVGIFESLLCQYNALDNKNAEGMAYAKEKGLGVAVMGPLGGGLIAGFPDETAAKIGVKAKRSTELGLRFVATNPDVDVICSGMSSVEQVVENAEIVSRIEALSGDELAAINKMIEDNKRVADLYCTGCNYCAPCPQTVEIANIFKYVNLYKVYGAKEYALQRYDGIGTGWSSGKKADACSDCGECEAKCPQNIEIRKQLKEALQLFG